MSVAVDMENIRRIRTHTNCDRCYVKQKTKRSERTVTFLWKWIHCGLLNAVCTCSLSSDNNTPTFTHTQTVNRATDLRGNDKHASTIFVSTTMSMYLLSVQITNVVQFYKHINAETYKPQPPMNEIGLSQYWYAFPTTGFLTNQFVFTFCKRILLYAYRLIYRSKNDNYMETISRVCWVSSLDNFRFIIFSIKCYRWQIIDWKILNNLNNPFTLQEKIDDTANETAQNK